MSHSNGNNEEYSSDDSNDEDYVPCEGGNLGSEEEDSGDDETLLQDNNDDESSGRKKRKSKASGKQQKTSVSRKKRQKVEDEDSGAKLIASNLVDGIAVDCPKSEEESKKKADLLWADFLKDVGGPGSKNKQKEESSDIKETPAEEKQEKVTVVKEFNFAGETVRVSSEVDANSKEAKEIKSNPSTSSSSSSSAVSNSSTPVIKRPAGGLGSLLDKLQKKPKMSVLEKSKLDWTGFKRQEGIEEELQQHNRGKNGYLEKVAFLQQADLKQYEIERNLRMSSRKPT